MKKLNLCIAFIAAVSIGLHAQPNTTPPDVNGTLVLDADAVSGFTPAAWADKSGSGNNLSVNSSIWGASSPVAVTSHGMAAVNFGGNSVMQTASLSVFDTAATVFIVSDNGEYSLNTNAPISIVETGVDLNYEFTIEANTTYHHSSPSNWVGKAHQCEPGVDTGQIIVQTGAWHTGTAATDVDMFLNGEKSNLGVTTYGTAVDYISVPRTINIGSRMQGGALYHPFTSNIYRILVYNSRLTDSDISAVNNYLLNQYNVVQSGCTNSLHEVSNNLNNVSVAPNPFGQTAVVTFDSEVEGTFAARVTNLLGEVVSTKTIHVKNGSNEFNLEKNGLSAGIYILSIADGNGSVSKKIVID